MKANKAQFEAFVAVQELGSTNMYDVEKVITEAKGLNNVKLSREVVLDITYNYDDYKKEYDK